MHNKVNKIFFYPALEETLQQVQDERRKKFNFLEFRDGFL
jgi:hypothetical protein